MNKIIKQYLSETQLFKVLGLCFVLSNFTSSYTHAETYKVIDEIPKEYSFEVSGQDYVACANIRNAGVRRGDDVCLSNGYSKDNCKVTAKTIYKVPIGPEPRNSSSLQEWDCSYEIDVKMQKIDIVPENNEILVKNTDIIIDRHIVDLLSQINQNNVHQGVFLSYNDQKFDRELFGAYKVLALDTDKYRTSIDLGELCLITEYQYVSSINRYAQGVVNAIGNVRNSLFTLSLLDTKETCHSGNWTFFGINDPKYESRRFKAMLSIR